MEGHLAALDATLASIASLQRQMFTSPTPQPFTNAFLTSTNSALALGDQPRRNFIRECDAFERNLFHFPAPGSMLNDEPDQRHAGEDDEAAHDVAAEILPRRPQVKSVSVPTPLRPGAADGSLRDRFRQQKQYDAHTSLIAAQKLNDTYQRAPRARKHIRQLLKHNSDLISQSSSHTTQVAKLEQLLSRFANQEDPKVMAEEIALALGRNTAVGEQGRNPVSEEDRRQKNRIREMRDHIEATRSELNREEMEVLALEEMREDILKRKEALGLASSQLRQGPTGSSKVPAAVPRVVAAARSAKEHDVTTGRPAAPTVTDTKATSSPSSAAARAKSASSLTKSQRLSSTPALSRKMPSTAPVSSEASKTLSNEPAQPKERDAPPAQVSQPRQRSSSDDGDATIQAHQPERVQQETSPGIPVAASAIGHTSGDPEPSDELGRLTEKIWDYFGDHLRFFAPGSETTSSAVTLQLLRKAIATASDSPEALQAARAAADNASSSAAGSSASAATTVSPPTLSARVSAFVLLMLLRSQDSGPDSHSLDFPVLKSRTKEWFDNPANVRDAERQGSDLDTAARSEGGGEALATKVVYAMVAKKLLRIRRTGGKARVGFS